MAFELDYQSQKDLTSSNFDSRDATWNADTLIWNSTEGFNESYYARKVSDTFSLSYYAKKIASTFTLTYYARKS